ncbi:MAG: hypothetical protein V4644_02720 [Patescibacteria group bacterium]
MDRSELFDAKAAEVTESLQSWAKELLAPGEQIIVSFRVQSIPAIIRDPAEIIEIENEFLDMGFMDFFSVERLRESEDGGSVATRTNTCLFYGSHSVPTLRDFLRTYDAEAVSRIPNLGFKSLVLIQRTLEKVGLSLRDPRGLLKKGQ